MTIKIKKYSKIFSYIPDQMLVAIFAGLLINLILLSPAFGGEYQITSNGLAKSDLAISGTRVVWFQDDGSGNKDIIYHNLSQGNTVALTSNGTAVPGLINLAISERNLDISGELVVWVDSQYGALSDESDILLIDLSASSSTVYRVTNDSALLATMPCVDGNRIVWVERGGTTASLYQDSVIYYCDYIAGSGPGAKVLVARSDEGSDPGYPRTSISPAISGYTIVWLNTYGPPGGIAADPSDFRIFYYNISTGVTTETTYAGRRLGSPQIFGNYIVFDHLPLGIHLHTISPFGALVINEPYIYSDWSAPSISDNLVVWQDNRPDIDADQEIFVYDITTNLPSTAAPITANLVDDIQPAVSFGSDPSDPSVQDENRIVWLRNNEVFIYDPSTNPPFVNPDATFPGGDASSVPTNANIIINLKDSISGVDISSVAVWAFGGSLLYIIDSWENPVGPYWVTSTGPYDYILTFDPPFDFDDGETVTVVVEAQDNAGNSMATYVYSFTPTSTVTCTDSDIDGYFLEPHCGTPQDCDDGNNGINPGAEEIFCDAIDQNCNGPADDDINADGDSVSLCNGDCNDNDPLEYPGQEWYKDADGDGYHDGTVNNSSCIRPIGYKTLDELIDTAIDCQDGAGGAAINPGATEIPDNGIDEDCDGADLDTIAPTFELTIPSAPTAPLDTNIEVHVRDSGSGVVQGSIVMMVKGSAVTPVITGPASDLTLFYDPPNFTQGETVSVAVSASDTAGNSSSAPSGPFEFQALSSGLARCEVDGADDSDCDGIPDSDEDVNGNGVVDVGETDPDTKTLFVRPNQWDTDLTSAPYINYWPKFLELFPSTRAGFAEIPALTAEGIEVVVIGDPRHLDPGGYAPWGNFEHNPATDSTRPYCDIMEIVYYDNRNLDGFFYCDDYGDCENNNGHNYFYNGLATADAPHWLFDVMGYTPGSPIDMHGYTHHYRTPRVYQRVLDNYFGEGAYAQIAPAQYPETTTCDNAHCQPDMYMDVSPFNLKDSESGPSFSQPPDTTVEFNDITFNADGSVQAVGTNDKERYENDEVLARTLVHEMGHGLGLVGHCLNPLCIMYDSVLYWELLGHEGQTHYGFGSTGTPPSPPWPAGSPPVECDHSPSRIYYIGADYAPATGIGVFNKDN